MSALSALVKGEIEEHMARRGMTTDQLASATGIPVVRLRRRLANPTTLLLNELAAIADALEVSPLALIGTYDEGAS